jgi:hypothetical protein
VKAIFDAETRMNSRFGAIFSPESLKLSLFVNRLSERPHIYWHFEARETRGGAFPFWP